MHRISRFAALTCLALVVTAGLALAAIKEGTYTGLSDDAEPVTMKVDKTDHGKFVKMWKVDQAGECAVTKFTKTSDGMPAKIRDGKFTIKDKFASTVVFKVKGEFEGASAHMRYSPDVLGSYSQTACDGQRDTWNALLVK